MVDQSYIDIAISTACLGSGISVLAWWESGREKRLQRKAWKRYIKNSKRCPSRVQEYRSDRASARG